MAIPFLQPDEDESARQHGNGLPPAGAGGGSGSGNNNSASVAAASANVPAGAPPLLTGATGPIPVPGSPAPSGTTTAVQTPLIGPMNGDQLVQLFYEALYRYSRGDTPSTPISQSPQSTSCSPFTTGYYSGQVFFPQTPNAVQRPLPGAAGRGGVFFGLPTPSPSGSSSHSSQNSANSPNTPSCSSAGPIFHQFPTSFSGTGSSTSPASTAAASSSSWNDEGDESSESDSSQPSSGAGCSSHCLGLPAHDGSSSSGSGIGGGNGCNSGSGTMGLMAVANPGFIPPHLDYMAGREQLQEFAGKIPQRKKKSKANKSKKSRFLEQTLVWPTLAVTATLIALGCGLLAAR
ncbi:mucin-19-like [Malaya genurostris]|uniref:mucin-19-like n=1 Tax=Malaya genurostris TaxID=325434 RepID=UPI0026F38E54|nr:mucin-19-like [Malaya genurostris]